MWRMVAATTVAVLLFAQIGLACHAAAHLHDAHETTDCDLCLVGSHFVADTPVALDSPVIFRANGLPFGDESDLAESPRRLPIARGPPSNSV